MTGSNQPTAEEAAQQLSQGNIDFSVLAATKGETSTQYIITLPKAGRRKGPFGRGGYTKFGRDALLTLNSTPHVEVNVGYSAPHVMTLYVSILSTDAPHPSHRLKGLPEPVAVTVQLIIMRNHGFIQRCAEYLRRLF